MADRDIALLLGGVAVGLLVVATLVQFALTRPGGAMPRMRAQAVMLRRFNLIVVVLAVLSLGAAIYVANSDRWWVSFRIQDGTESSYQPNTSRTETRKSIVATASPPITSKEMTSGRNHGGSGGASSRTHPGLTTFGIVPALLSCLTAHADAHAI